MKFVIRIIIIAVNAFLLAEILPGVSINNFFTAILVAFVLALLDLLVKPIIILLTLPATLLTLGLFLFVVNAIIISIDAYFVHGFKIESFTSALIFSLLLSIANGFVLGRLKSKN